MYSRKDLTKTTLAAAVLLALGTGVANAGTTTGNNFTMINNTGGLQGGTNDVTFTWDGTLRTIVVTDGTSNATLSSITPFAAAIWTAHNVNVYGPGTYVFDTTSPVGNGAQCTANCNYTLVVPAGYLGAHMLFNWSTSSNIDVVQLWKINNSWDATGGDPVGSTTSPDPFCVAPYTNGSCHTVPNPNSNTRNTVFSLISIDTPESISNKVTFGQLAETNLYHGTKMIDGPFVGSSANFNVKLNGASDTPPTPPTAFTFTDQTGIALSTLTESAPITVSGTAGNVYIISVSGTGGEYAIGTGGTYAAYTSSPGTVIVGQTVKARHTSSSANGTPTDTEVTIGGLPDTFTTTTVGVPPSDTTPDSFTFTAQPGVATSAVITSNTITVRGINTATNVSISGGEYSINGGTYASAGTTVSNNDTVAVHHTSSSANSTATTTTLTIGGRDGTFTSTTVAPPPAVVDAADPKMPGCSIANTTAIQPSGRAEWWLVGGFLALLGILRRRRVS